MVKSYNTLFENNKKWVTSKLKENPEYFNKLSKGQTPEYLWIGCSDSRVPAKIGRASCRERVLHTV
jgi:carbonic anhydrase